MSAHVNETDAASSSPFAIEFTLQASDFYHEWSRCSILANYLGMYIAYQFVQRERAENLIATIVNEFLESVVALLPGSSPLSLSCTLLADELRIEVGHQIRAELLDPYLEFLESLCPNPDQESFLELLISEERPDQYFNQLGLTMLKYDFGAHITSQFDEKTRCLQTQLVASMQESVEGPVACDW